MHVYRCEPGLNEQLPGPFLTPHRAQPFAVVGQGHRHAMQRRGGVEEGRHRQLDVTLQMARTGDVHAQPRAVGLQRRGDACHHVGRSGLVVYRIERGDEVERAGAQVGRVGHLEAGVGQPHGSGLGSGPVDGQL